ncbi:MAG: DUF378 domain-containing protein [bacterium]|nr:DUF378 domain-containing protein [bacterium]
MKNWETVAWWLVVIGAINWGLVGLANINLVNVVVGSWPTLEKVVYLLVGLSGLWLLWGKVGK